MSLAYIISEPQIIVEERKFFIVLADFKNIFFLSIMSDPEINPVISFFFWKAKTFSKPCPVYLNDSGTISITT